MVLPQPATDGLSHDPLESGSEDHHLHPKQVTIENTTQVIAGMSTFDLDIPLGSSGYQMAFVQLFGIRYAYGFSNRGREMSDLVATRNSSEGFGSSARDAAAGGLRHYSATFNKAAGDAFLSFKIYDNWNAPGQEYISIKEIYLTGSNLRIVFYNHTATSKTLWVKGLAQVY